MMIGIPELDSIILLYLSDGDLRSVGCSNTYTRSLCKDPHFWRKRIAHRYGISVSSPPQALDWMAYYSWLKHNSYDEDYIAVELGLSPEETYIRKETQMGSVMRGSEKYLGLRSLLPRIFTADRDTRNYFLSLLDKIKVKAGTTRLSLDYDETISAAVEAGNERLARDFLALYLREEDLPYLPQTFHSLGRKNNIHLYEKLLETLTAYYCEHMVAFVQGSIEAGHGSVDSLMYKILNTKLDRDSYEPLIRIAIRNMDSGKIYQTINHTPRYRNIFKLAAIAEGYSHFVEDIDKLDPNRVFTELLKADISTALEFYGGHKDRIRIWDVNLPSTSSVQMAKFYLSQQLRWYVYIEFDKFSKENLEEMLDLYPLTRDKFWELVSQIIVKGGYHLIPVVEKYFTEQEWRPGDGYLSAAKFALACGYKDMTMYFISKAKIDASRLVGSCSNGIEMNLFGDCIVNTPNLDMANAWIFG